MRTNNLNVLEAINFALAGHTVEVVTKDTEYKSIFCKNDKLYVGLQPDLLRMKHSTRLLDGLDIISMAKSDIVLNAGDNKTIKGYY